MFPPVFGLAYAHSSLQSMSRERNAAGAVQAGKQLVRMRPICPGLERNHAWRLAQPRGASRKEGPDRRGSRTDPRPTVIEQLPYFEELSLSEDLREPRGVIDTTLYSRSLASASSTSSNILSL